MMGLGMLFALPVMFLFSVLVLAVPALAVVWAGREFGRGGAGQPAQPVQPTGSDLVKVCPHCHRGIGADWSTCAYCGQKLA